MFRRSLSMLVVLCFTLFVVFGIFKPSWRFLPSLRGSDGPTVEQIKSGEGILPDLRAGKHDATLDNTPGFRQGGKPIDPNAWRAGKENGKFREPKVDVNNPYPIGQTKAPGSNYTRALVMPKMASENTSWIAEELGDMLQTGMLETAIYEMDNPDAKYHPIMNKGHEPMAYLSYIIDHYEALPDIAIFMHAHRSAWHNNIILDKDASLIVRYLSPERVTREGYMNLRCHWEPGCPEWLHPSGADAEEFNEEKKEEHIFAKSWKELFPNVSIPSTLAQPCCAQFAVSRERLLSIPKEQFISLRDWLLHTTLNDFLAGRIFEYTWQYIFTSLPYHCPSMSVCYCDGFGLCFGTPEKFDYYFELLFNYNEYKEELREWHVRATTLESVRLQQGGRLSGEERVVVPEPGRDEWLRVKMDEIEGQMKHRKEQAFERGRDPQNRAKEAGRDWKEGDGF